MTESVWKWIVSTYRTCLVVEETVVVLRWLTLQTRTNLDLWMLGSPHCLWLEHVRFAMLLHLEFCSESAILSIQVCSTEFQVAQRRHQALRHLGSSWILFHLWHKVVCLWERRRPDEVNKARFLALSRSRLNLGPKLKTQVTMTL